MGVDLYLLAEVRRGGRWEAARDGFGAFSTRTLELLMAVTDEAINWRPGLPADRDRHLDEDLDDRLEFLDDEVHQPMWCTLADLEGGDWSAVRDPDWKPALERLRALVPDEPPQRGPLALRRRGDPRERVRILAYWT